jgi:hypothetical protein
MPDVTAKPVTKPDPAKVAQTVIDVRVLTDASGNGVPVFNQGEYTDSLPVQNDAGDRTIQSSGCGLCAVAACLAAAGCRTPVLVGPGEEGGGTLSGRGPAGNKFSLPSGAAIINPSTLLQYFIDYSVWVSSTPADAKTYAAKYIFASTDSGVLQNGSSTVRAATNHLVALSQGIAGEAAQFDNTCEGGGGATGTDIPGVSSALQAGNPVLLAVCFSGNPCNDHGNHIVLAVGIAKIGSTTLYVINDSGFSPMDPLPVLKQGGKVTLDAVNACTASSKRAKSYTGILKYRVLGGLQSFTNLALKPLFQS